MSSVAEPVGPGRYTGLREQKKQATRAAIVEAALDLFADRGFDDTTVADVAARARVSPATVARYFPSKESLLFAESDQRVPMLRQAIVDRPENEGPVQAVLAALHQQPWAAGEDGDTRRRLLRSRQAILRSSVLRGQSSALLAGWRHAISAALASRGLAAADAHLVAVVVAALLDDAADRWALDGGAGDLVGLIDGSFSALERTFGRIQRHIRSRSSAPTNGPSSATAPPPRRTATVADGRTFSRTTRQADRRRRDT